MAGHINHQAPVAKPWLVLNPGAGDLIFIVLCEDDLCQALHGIDGPCISCTADADSFCFDVKGIAGAVLLVAFCFFNDDGSCRRYSTF